MVPNTRMTASLKRLAMNMLMRRRNETLEQRMRLVRFAQKFRMELARHEERMILEFDDLHQLAIGRKPAENETSLLEFLAVGVVEFIAMAVALINDERAIKR